MKSLYWATMTHPVLKEHNGLTTTTQTTNDTNRVGHKTVETT